MSEIQESVEETEDFQDIFEAEEEKVEVAVEEPEVEEPQAEAEPEPTTDSKPDESPDDSKWDKDSWMYHQAMDERKKAQERADEVERLRKQLESYEKPAEERVSVFENEDEYNASIDQKITQAAQSAKLDALQVVANREFGKEQVDTAIEWYRTEAVQSPYTIQKILGSDDPYHTLMEVFEHDQIMRDPEAYKAKLRAEVEAESRGKETVPKSVTPSLASQKSAGSKTTADDFEDLLKD